MFEMLRVLLLPLPLLLPLLLLVTPDPGAGGLDSSAGLARYLSALCAAHRECCGHGWYCTRVSLRRGLQGVSAT